MVLLWREVQILINVLFYNWHLSLGIKKIWSDNDIFLVRVVTYTEEQNEVIDDNNCCCGEDDNSEQNFRDTKHASNS